ncbi:hypothetical protein Slin15195_G091680 [Septoria linicola]|uniref:Uncharacterized protein n=1 Tax=Septoria linicola TaxID=215465 RepID=A0A9Q9AUW2_9PEZI|nr:hypothetical protein Slin15195_G091680 [Septoria linicola]
MLHPNDEVLPYDMPLHPHTRPTWSQFYQFDYDSCTAEELRQFLQARQKHQQSPPKELEKEELISSLQDLDKLKAFDLTKLPKDLRLHVYEHLAFHPQILATSRQIYSEALPCLGQRITTISIKAPQISSDTPILSVGDKTWPAPLQTFRYPSLLATQVESLADVVPVAGQIEIVIEVKANHILLERMNCLLYILATVLNKAQRTEIRLRIRITSPLDPDGYNYRYITDALLPLTKLGPGVFLLIHECPAHIRKAFDREFSKAGIIVTAMFDYMNHEAEVCAEMALLKRASMSIVPHYGVLHHLKRWDSYSGHNLCEIAWERLRREVLVKRRKSFDKTQLRTMREKALEILAKRDKEVCSG